MIEQLKNPELRFCKIRKGTKKPIEKDWVNKPYTWQEIEEHINKNINYGIICGYGGLIVIDSDKPELRDSIEKNLPKTLTIKTGSGGTHFYYFCKSLKKKIVLSTDKDNHYGEVQSFGSQVVGTESIHPNGNKYEILIPEPIKEITLEQLHLAIKPFMKEIRREENKIIKELKNYGNNDINSISILNIINNSGFKKASNGEFYGSNPFHGSTTGINFWINPFKNVAHCFRCDCGMNVAQIIGLNEGIIKNCSDKLNKENFLKVLEIAKDKYGLINKIKRIKEHLEREKIVLMTKFSPVPFAKKLLINNKFMQDKYKRFWRYSPEDGIWKENAEEIIKLELRSNLFGDEQQKNNYVNEVIGYIKDITYNKNCELSDFKHLIAFDNCIYDLEKEEIKNFSPEYFITNKIPVKLDSNYTSCDIIDSFFVDIVGNEYKIILYELCAYCLCNHQPYQKLFFLTGDGANGKSTFLEMLRTLLGNENVSSVTPHDLCGNNRFAIGSMWNKKANISTDISYELLKNINKIKEITGGDTITIERKYKEAFSDRIYSKQIFATNQPPIVTDRTRAWYRRIYLIDFPNRFEGKLRDPEMLKKITDGKELNGLAWQLIKHLQNIKKNKWVFTYDIDVEKITKVYEDLSNPLNRFLKETIEEDSEGKIWKFEFREKFENWLKDKRLRIWNDREIGLMMKELYDEQKLTYQEGFGNIPSKRYWAWTGLKWRPVQHGQDVQLIHYNTIYIYSINKVVDK